MVLDKESSFAKATEDEKGLPSLKLRKLKMVGVVQPVRTSDCGSEGRGFEPHLPPQETPGYC